MRVVVTINGEPVEFSKTTASAEETMLELFRVLSTLKAGDTLRLSGGYLSQSGASLLSFMQPPFPYVMWHEESGEFCLRRLPDDWLQPEAAR